MSKKELRSNGKRRRRVLRMARAELLRESSLYLKEQKSYVKLKLGLESVEALTFSFKRDNGCPC